MKAWQIVSKHRLEPVEVNQQRSDNEVKIKITKSAFSSTDKAIIEGRGEVYPIIPVRAAIGLVSEATGAFRLGERVVIDPYVCDFGDARPDTEGLVPNVKIMGVDVPGLLRDFAIVPRDNVCSLPENVKDSDALFTEYIALGLKTLSVLGVKKGDYLAVIGANTLGNIIAQLAVYYQAIPILVDSSPTKLKLAEKYGIYYTINSEQCDVERRVLEITSGRRADRTVYEGKSILPPSYAVSLTKDCGRVAFVGYSRFLEKELRLSNILKKQLTIVGVENGFGDIKSALNMLATKAIQTDGLVDKEITFDEIPKLLTEISEWPLTFSKIIINS
ncbi:MAG: zinc-binding dehydrogenase [Clostridiaceae bacterium]|jgi:threonine dehydrogenase-like Zn-dependent dehydrogenase|nr:zinc-binding dehydrogenase [Clostridiaceae bacterium]